MHVDALSRVQNILVLEGNSLEQTLALKGLDLEITKIREQLENTEFPGYELRNGLVSIQERHQ